MRLLRSSRRVTPTSSNPSNSNNSNKIGLTVISVAFAVGIVSYTVFPNVALYLGLITSEQYVEITTKFFEFGFKIFEMGTSIIPSIIPWK